MANALMLRPPPAPIYHVLPPGTTPILLGPPTKPPPRKPAFRLTRREIKVWHAIYTAEGRSRKPKSLMPSHEKKRREPISLRPGHQLLFKDDPDMPKQTQTAPSKSTHGDEVRRRVREKLRQQQAVH